MKRHLLTAMPTPSVVVIFKSKVQIGTRIKIRDAQLIKIENHGRVVNQLRETEQEKVNSRPGIYCRINVNTLEELKK